MSLVPGKNFGKYQVVKLLGRRGMGEVYLATDRSLNRQVAIKVLSSDLIESPDQLRRFSKEGRLAAALSHPNICTIYDTQEFEGQTYICMEYVEGVTLRQHIATQPMKLPEVLDIAIQIADALDEARYRGQYDLALRNWQAVLQEVPDRPLYQINVADALRQLGQKNEARSYYTKAIDGFRVALASNPADDISRGGMAMALAAVGKCEEAADEARTILVRHSQVLS